MSAPARIRTVNGLRGMAAVLVVVDHAIDDSWGLGPWTEQNHGITIFALLTGFLLSGSFLEARLSGGPLPNFLSFMRARVARIFPGYWVALGIAALTVGLHAMGPGDTLRVFTLTQTFDTDTPFEGLIPMWSLSLFLSFYLLLPLWAWARRRAERPGSPPAALLRREVRWLLGLIAVAFLVRTFSLTDPIANDSTFSVFGRADWFAAGMLLAVLIAARSRGLAPRLTQAPGRYPGLAFGAALLLTVVSGALPLHLWELRNQLDLLAAVLLVYGAVLHGSTLRGPQRVLASRPAEALGRWSYGIFLWGYVAEKAIAEVIPGIGTGALVLTTLAAGIALGAVSWKFIEEPCARLLRERRARTRDIRIPDAKRPETAIA